MKILRLMGPVIVGVANPWLMSTHDDQSSVGFYPKQPLERTTRLDYYDGDTSRGCSLCRMAGREGLVCPSAGLYQVQATCEDDRSYEVNPWITRREEEGHRSAMYRVLFEGREQDSGPMDIRDPRLSWLEERLNRFDESDPERRDGLPNSFSYAGDGDSISSGDQSAYGVEPCADVYCEESPRVLWEDWDREEPEGSGGSPGRVLGDAIDLWSTMVRRLPGGGDGDLRRLSQRMDQSVYVTPSDRPVSPTSGDQRLLRFVDTHYSGVHVRPTSEGMVRGRDGHIPADEEDI